MFWDSPDTSQVVRQLVWQHTYTIFITNIHALFHMWQRKNLVSKYNDHDCSIKIILYEMSQVAEQGKTYDLRKLGNIRKI